MSIHAPQRKVRRPQRIVDKSCIDLPLVSISQHIRSLKEAIGSTSTVLGEVSIDSGLSEEDEFRGISATVSVDSGLCDEDDFRGIPATFARNLRKSLTPLVAEVPKWQPPNDRLRALAETLLRHASDGTTCVVFPKV